MRYPTSIRNIRVEYMNLSDGGNNMAAAATATAWSRTEDKIFENALVEFPEEMADRWEKIAGCLAGKSVEDVMVHYESLLYDITQIEAGVVDDHYIDDYTMLMDGKKTAAKTERKKGIPWTMEEHLLFLRGLDIYGHGDWRSISRCLLTTRKPSQVASHAQKFIIRKKASIMERKRSSIHDCTSVAEAEEFIRLHTKPNNNNNVVNNNDALVPMDHFYNQDNNNVNNNDALVSMDHFYNQDDNNNNNINNNDALVSMDFYNLQDNNNNNVNNDDALVSVDFYNQDNNNMNNVNNDDALVLNPDSNYTNTHNTLAAFTPNQDLYMDPDTFTSMDFYLNGTPSADFAHLLTEQAVTAPTPAPAPAPANPPHTRCERFEDLYFTNAAQ